MRFLSVLAITAALALPAAAQGPHTNGGQTVWCREATPIDLAECRATRPRAADGWLQLVRDGDCLGRPGDATGELRCVTFTLVDADEKVPVAGECSVTIAGDVRTLKETRDLAAGEMAVPTWCERVRVACPGFVDATLGPGDLEHTVYLPPGRRVLVTVTASRPAGTDAKQGATDAQLTLRHSDSDSDAVPDADQERTLRLGQMLDLGSLPKGSYDLRITSNHSAPLVESFRLVPSADPLELAYRLPEAFCLPVQVTCSGCERNAVTYSMQRFHQAAAPQSYASGQLQVQGVDRGVLNGRICGLAAGDYRLALTAEGRVPAAQVVAVGPDVPAVALELAAGTASHLYLVDGDGIPVPDAEVAVRWRTRRGPQRASISSDESGTVTIPALPADTAFRAYVHHDGLVPRDVEAVAGDETVVQLTRRGAIRARLVGEACTTPDAGVVALVSWESSERNQSGQDSYEPDHCVFEIPVPQPGTYEVTFQGPDFVSHHETLDLVDSLDADLGDVELERGASIRVKVLHHASPVAGAAVRVGREGPARLSDEGGVVDLSSLADDGAPQEVELVVSHPAYAVRRMVVTVAEGDEVPVELSVGAAVYGMVANDDGTPAAGETISAWSPEAEMRSATVDGGGHYELTRLQPGRWTLYRMRVAGGYSTGGMMMRNSDQRTATLIDGERHQVDFEPELEVRGRVALDGSPVHDPITMTAVRQGGPAPAMVPVRVDASGQFATRLPGAGLWLFAYRDARFTARIESCPCLVDVELVSAGYVAPTS